MDGTLKIQLKLKRITMKINVIEQAMVYMEVDRAQGVWTHV